jgi:glycine cleavage system transcriptional repressor
MTPTLTADTLRSGWLPYQVSVTGADHEGIIHEIASGLSQRGITIESMDTGTAEAPVSGTTLFSMTALVLVPSHLPEDDWISALAEAGDQANVDIEVSAAS